jgi:hypothetical protein
MSDSSGGEFGPWNDESTVKRRFRRWYVDFETVLTVRGTAMNCRVVDLSPGGACVEVQDWHDIAADDRLLFELPGYGSIEAEVRYRGERYLGLMFLNDDAGEVAVARYLVAVEQSRRPARHDVSAEAHLVAGSVDTTCVVDDISRIGARILVDDTRHFSVGQEVSVHLEGIGRVTATVQRVDDRELGLMFLQELSSEPVLGAPNDEGDESES